MVQYSYYAYIFSNVNMECVLVGLWILLVIYYGPCTSQLHVFLYVEIYTRKV